MNISRIRGTIILVFIACLVLGSGVLVHSSRASQEPRETTVFEVGPFDEIHLRGAGAVTVVFGDEPSVEITAPARISQLFSVGVEDGELTGGFAASVAFDLLTTEGIDYLITTPSLTALELTGPLQATIDGLTASEFDLELSTAAGATLTNVTVDDLEIDLDFASAATVSGTATTQDIEMANASTYEAADLETTTTAVDLSTASTATVRVVDTLNGSVNSASTLNYISENASVTVTTGTAGSVRQLPFVALAPQGSPVVATPVVGTPVSAATPVAAAPQKHDIAVSQFKFVPATLEIQVGDTVTWTNNDRFAHDVTELPKGSGFASPAFAKGESYSHLFDTPGTYDYYCALHPIMLGTIVVVE